MHGPKSTLQRLPYYGLCAVILVANLGKGATAMSTAKRVVYTVIGDNRSFPVSATTDAVNPGMTFEEVSTILTGAYLSWLMLGYNEGSYPSLAAKQWRDGVHDCDRFTVIEGRFRSIPDAKKAGAAMVEIQR